MCPHSIIWCTLKEISFWNVCCLSPIGIITTFYEVLIVLLIICILALHLRGLGTLAKLAILSTSWFSPHILSIQLKKLCFISNQCKRSISSLFSLTAITKYEKRWRNRLGSYNFDTMWNELLIEVIAWNKTIQRK
jgi:hypothetical protein